MQVKIVTDSVKMETRLIERVRLNLLKIYGGKK